MEQGEPARGAAGKGASTAVTLAPGRCCRCNICRRPQTEPGTPRTPLQRAVSMSIRDDIPVIRIRILTAAPPEDEDEDEDEEPLVVKKPRRPGSKAGAGRG